jgi:hypothetical protein
MILFDENRQWLVLARQWRLEIHPSIHPSTSSLAFIRNRQELHEREEGEERENDGVGTASASGSHILSLACYGHGRDSGLGTEILAPSPSVAVLCFLIYHALAAPASWTLVSSISLLIRVPEYWPDRYCLSFRNQEQKSLRFFGLLHFSNSPCSCVDSCLVDSDFS